MLQKCSTFYFRHSLLQKFWPVAAIASPAHRVVLVKYLEFDRGIGFVPSLAPIRHSLSITENDSTFSDLIQAAWLDFQNPQLF